MLILFSSNPVLLLDVVNYHEKILFGKQRTTTTEGGRVSGRVDGLKIAIAHE